MKIAAAALGIVAITGLSIAAQAGDLWGRRALIYPYIDRDPAHPGESVSPTPDPQVTRGLSSFRVVEPKPWGQSNEAVKPPAGTKAPSHEGH